MSFQSGLTQLRNNFVQTLNVIGNFNVFAGATFEVATTGTAVTNILNHTLTIQFRTAFKPRRGRINCSLNDNGKWRWFGVQFPIKEN